MENKKISFGFSKVSKKTEILSKVKPEKQVELIDCLENHSIKIKGESEKKDEPQALVIPIQGPSNKFLDELKKVKRETAKNKNSNEEEVKPDSELSIDELAARELIREAQTRDAPKTETKVFSLPLKEEKFVADGAEEPSLQDYESIPISDYGMAMLRGMNWKEGMPIGRQGKKAETPKLPELRPKGLGLGANKLVATNKPQSKNEEELKLVKGAYCKIIAGNHRGHYCQVQSFDDESFKVIVKTALTNEVLSLNEFLIIVVSKEEYAKNFRVINNAKYEEYKSNESERGTRSRSRDRSRTRKKHKKEKKHSEDGRRHRKKNKSRDRSSSSDSDNRRRNKNKRR